MAQLVRTIRASGAGNVVIADGLDHGHTLDGAPLLGDPDAAVVYGIEPYQRAGDGPDSWDRDFGALATSRAVLASEWDAAAAPPSGAEPPQTCDPSTPMLAAALLRYLGERQIGVIGFAFDLTGTLVRDQSFALTSYDRFACGVGGGGPGELLSNDFRSAPG